MIVSGWKIALNLTQVEIGLRLIDPTVSIPYWDNVMDNYLPDPRDSILFSPIFEGEVDNFGFVVTGPYAYWRTIDGSGAILRMLGREGSLWTEYTLNDIMMQTTIENMLHYTAPLQGCPLPMNLNALEFVHSYIHLWIGGHMHDPPTSANDPIFYPYHAFVDFVWELWRQTHQTPQAREMEYPPDIAICGDPQHFGNSFMRPYFNLINRDGLSNMYTDQMYRYAPRPGCSAQMPACGSQYLFCDVRGVPHCVSKIKPYGVCVGFEGLDACFNSVCQNGRCVPGPTPPPFVPRTQLPAAQRAQISRSHASRTFVACFNRNPCCELWAEEGECRQSKEYMRHFCPAACDVCKPAYNATNGLRLIV
uniref:ShKT domain-containing protein n=1 Tax=Ascaris lumbricoides TaxID=6252 RepID=A0A9J2Q8W3_ASCLU